MTDIFNMIKKDFFVRTVELARTAIVASIGFVFGLIILVAVMTFDNSADLTSFEMGTVMSAFFMIFSKVYMDSMWYAYHLNYAVSMGQCRTHVVTAHMAVALVKSLIDVSLIYIFHTIEAYICSTVYGKYPADFDFSTIFTPANFFIFLIALTAMEVFFGAMNARFGQKAMGIIWLLCMGCVMIPAFIERALEQVGDIGAKLGHFFINLFTRLGGNVLLSICVTAVILLMLLPYAILRKHRVSL